MPTPTPGVPWTGGTVDDLTAQVRADAAGAAAQADALVTNQAPLLVAYTAALAAGAARIVNYGDSMSAPIAGDVTWPTWPFIAETAMAKTVGGTADTDATTPTAGANWRLWNRSINASSMTDHITAGSGIAADLTAIDPHLVIISCGLATWLTDKTGATYLASVQAGIDAIRATKPAASILVVHEYEPSLNLAAPNTFALWGDTTEGPTRDLAAANGCAYISLYRPFGTVAGDADPRDVLTADLTHPNTAGQQLIWGVLAPLIGQQRRTTGAATPTDLGQSRSTSTAELSVLTAVMAIPAGTLSARDELFFRAKIGSINLSGSAATIIVRLKIGGTTIFTSAAIAIANGTGIQWDITCPIFAEGVGASSIIRCEPLVAYGPGNNAALTATLSNTTAGTPLTVSTLADINIDLTTQHGGAGGGSAAMISECTWATLSRLQRVKP
jgi:lysophospholipase L1-like esterase